MTDYSSFSARLNSQLISVTAVFISATTLGINGQPLLTNLTSYLLGVSFALLLTILLTNAVFFSFSLLTI